MIRKPIRGKREYISLDIQSLNFTFRTKKVVFMKRIKVKFEEIIEPENIRQALHSAAKNKRNRPIVKRCLENEDETVKRIIEILKSPNRANYLSTGTTELRAEGTNKKERLICKPKFFPDQIIHWATMRVLSPYFTRCFYRHSYASIKGRGTHAAVRAMNGAFRKDKKNTKYCLQFDIRHAYDSVDKAKIIECVCRRIKDKRVVKLVNDIVYSYTLTGLPKGFYPSAWLFNLFLTPVDNYIKQECEVKYLFRYMDNFQIYGANKRKLAEIRNRIFNYINAFLFLQIKHDYQIYLMPYKEPKEGKKERRRFTDFVGFKMYRYKITIRKPIFKRVKRLLLRLKNGEYTVKRARQFFSYWGYIKATNASRLKAKYVYGKICIKKLKELTRNETLNSNPVGNNA